MKYLFFQFISLSLGVNTLLYILENIGNDKLTFDTMISFRFCRYSIFTWRADICVREGTVSSRPYMSHSSESSQTSTSLRCQESGLSSCRNNNWTRAEEV